VKFGDSTRTRVGDWVIAIGNPFGLGSTLTAGVVSALHRVTGQGGAYDRYIQTDASINQGNSGGPMFDLNGNVIGINTMIFSPTGGNVGIGFAIPAEEALPIVQQLQGGGTVQRGYLGVGIQSLDEGTADALGIAKNRGELIARVEPGEGAAKAGIKVGDVVLKVAGREVTPDETLSYLVANQKVGTRVPIELLRDGKRQTVTALVGQRPSEEKIASIGQNDEQGMAPEDEQSTSQAAKASLGLAVVPLTPDIARRLGVQSTVRGVVIGSVDPSSDAAAKGLQRGDVILSANNRPTLTPADVASAANSAKAAGRKNVLLQIQRGNGPPSYRAVKIAEG
jgi:serine protease Do